MGWIMIIAACVFMYRLAEMSERSGAIWAVITFVICLLCTAIPLPLINIGIGLLVSYLAMFAVTLVKS